MKGPLNYEELRAVWEPAADAQRQIYADGPERVRRARGSEVLAALQRMYDLTGHAVYRDAAAAMKRDGFNRANAGTWRPRHDEKLFVRRMHHILSRNKMISVRIAAARTAVEFVVPGQAFDAVVKRLERAYRRAKPI